MFDLSDRVVLVTGGASGIGLELVKLILKEPVKHVTFLDVAEDNGVKIQNELRKIHGQKRVRFCRCDVSKDDQLKSAYKTTVDEFGYIDVVFNVAGIAREAEYKLEIDVNLTGVVASTLHAIEVMHKGRGGHGGVVVNVSSIAALMLFSNLPIYSATKSGVLQFGTLVGAEPYYSKNGVRVITMCFGATRTPIVDNISFSVVEENTKQNFEDLLNQQTWQSPVSAARALIDSCKCGSSGSVWISTADRPAQEITHVYRQALALFEPYVNFKL